MQTIFLQTGYRGERSMINIGGAGGVSAAKQSGAKGFNTKKHRYNPLSN